MSFDSTIDKLEEAIKKEKDTRRVFAILLEVIKDVKDTINDLESRVSSLEGSIDDLESRVSTLEH